MGFGGGAPQTFSSGGNPAPYVPKAQPQMDALLQQVMGYFPTNPANTPAGQFYPEAQSAYGNWISPSNPVASYALNTAAQAGNLAGQAAPQLFGAGSNILNLGADPQQALFDRTQQQVLDQSNVARSMAGLGSTPYGASLNSNALSNFDINWQNNLLNRMITGAQAGGSLMQGASGLQAEAGALPYQTALGIGQNALGGLGSLVSLGNAQYALPQQLANDLQSYLQLGQSASGLALQGGNLGFNQTAQGIGGLLSGANSLFGGNGLFSGGGLFGGGGGSALSGAGAAFAPTGFATDTTFPIADIAGGGGGGAAGGGFLGSLLPTS